METKIIPTRFTKTKTKTWENDQIKTSKMAGRHRGPKRKLQAGYRVL